MTTTITLDNDYEVLNPLSNFHSCWRGNKSQNVTKGNLDESWLRVVEFLTGPLYQPGWARFCYRRKETLELHTIQFLSFTLSLANITCFSHYHHNGEKTKKTSQIASWLLSLGWKWYISHFIGKASEIGTIRPYQCMKGENQEYLMNGTNMLYATPGPLVTQTHWAPGLVA